MQEKNYDDKFCTFIINIYAQMYSNPNIKFIFLEKIQRYKNIH